MFPQFSEMPFTYIITGITVFISIVGFYCKPLYYGLVYHPYEVFKGKRIHTLFTSIFIHKGWLHLLFNVGLFYVSGRDLEYIILENNHTQLQIKLIYLFVLFVSAISINLITGWKQREQVNYTSVGASGVVFTFLGFSTLYLPLDHLKEPNKILPLYYGYDFLFGYLLVFVALMLVFRKKSNSNHPAHVLGLLLGAILAIVFRPEIIKEITYHLRARW